MSELVGTPKDRFSHVTDHIISTTISLVVSHFLFLAVLKVLEGSLSPDLMKKRNKIMNSPLTILELTKTQNGVWV